jgi:hypothetical protein
LIHLIVFGLNPKGLVERHPWMFGLDWAFVGLSVLLFAAVLASWLGVLLTSGSAPVHERRGLLVVTALVLVSAIGRRFETIAAVFIPCSIAEIGLLPMLLWYVAKAVGEETQRDIDAKLSRNLSAPSKSGPQTV